MKSLLFLLVAFTLQATPKDAQKLAVINKVNSKIKIRCMYASYDNFTGQRVYPARFFNRTFLLKHVAEQLSKVQNELEKQGLGLLIWDALRPMQGQQALWNVCPDARFVAEPSKGGRHTRGTTVDLTIVNLKTGEPLNMGAGFDAFIDRSATTFTDLPEEVLKNRKLLQDVMKKYGFNKHPREWWHFDYKNYTDYPPLDVTFEELDQL